MLKGQTVVSRNDLPVISCNTTSLVITVSDCDRVSIENLMIKCTILSLKSILTMNITNVHASGLHFNGYFSNFLLSNSNFLCKDVYSACVYICLNFGRLKLQDIVTSYGLSAGIVIIGIGNASIALYNVSTSNNGDDGMYIKLYQPSRVNVTDIMISNSRNKCLHLICNASYDIQLNNINASNCTYGIHLNLHYKNNVIMSRVATTNNHYGGILLFCSGAQNIIHLVNIATLHNHRFGMYVSSSATNDFYFSGVLIANNNEVNISDKPDNIALLALCASHICMLTFTGISINHNSATGMATGGRWLLNFTRNSSTIANNKSPTNGGGMWLSKSTVLKSDTKVYFFNNTARGFGGAVFVDEVTFINNDIFFVTFSQFMPIFENNSALIAGDNVYNGMYHFNAGDHNTFINEINCSSNWDLARFPKPLSSYVTSSPLGVCVCDNDSIVNCNNRSFESVLYPGQSITLSLVTVGICGGISPSVLVTSNTSSVEIVHMDSSQETERMCKAFTYTITQQYPIISKESIHFGIKTTIANIGLKGAAVEVNVSFRQCPRGLHIISGACHCDSIIGGVNGTHCDINMMPCPISRSGNIWLYYSKKYDCVIAHRTCPFDYCNTSTVNLNLNESDLQCTNGRSGILCGGCQPGLSLTLGSNKCEQCSNKYISLVVAFFLAGLALVIFLLVSNLTVSVGSINGLLFYANVIKLNEAVLFPNGVSIPVLSQFIAWLNLDLGIQTCFFNGLDGYWKTWLQFAFPLYIWLLIGGVIIGCYYSGRLARLCGNNAVPVLATLIFMSYTKLLRVITNILMLAVIRCKDTHWLVWSVDGNIGYLSSKHIPLFVIAMVFVFLGLVYTVLVFSAQWLQRYSGKCFKSSRDPVVKLKPFIDAYTGPYKDKYRYWTGLLLIVRLLMTTVFSYTTGTVPQINNYIIAVITAVLLYLSRGVYRDKRLNILEGFYLINLGLLVMLSALSDAMHLHINNVVTVISTSLSLVAFTLTSVFHIFIGNKQKCGLCVNICTNKSEEEEEPLLHSLLHEKELYSPARTVMRRESLIFDFNVQQ